MTNETSPMIMPHTGNASSLRWQELGRRKGAEAEEVVRDMGLLVASVSLFGAK